MPIEIQVSKGPVKTGTLAQFTFSQTVQAFALGMSAFNLRYSSDDHWVQSVKIKMLQAQNASLGASGNQITALVQITLQDDSGNSVDTSDAYVWPVCIAVTGSPDAQTAIGSANGIPNGSAQNVALPAQQSGYKIATCFQSGFDLSYAAKDHQVLQATAGCGLAYGGQSGQITASANLRDASGNQVQVANVDSGYIATTMRDPTFGVSEVSMQTNKPVPFQMKGMTSVKAAAVLIRTWNVKFPAVHNLKTLRVGSWGAPTIAGTAVTIPNLSATISDASQNSQDDAASYCDALVIAV